MISNDLKENSHISSKTEVGIFQKKKNTHNWDPYKALHSLARASFGSTDWSFLSFSSASSFAWLAKKGRNHPEKWENSLFWVVILFLCFFHSDASQRPSTVFFFQKLVCLWPCIPTSPIYNHHRNIGSHSNQPINPTCSISGVDLAFVSFGVPVSPFAFLGLRLLRGNFNGILPGESTKRFTSTTKLPKAKKTWIFGCHDSFFDMKKMWIMKKTRPTYPADSSFCQLG